MTASVCVCVLENDEMGQRKKTDEPTPDDDIDDQEESSTAEPDVEPPSSAGDQPEPNIQQANQSSPKKRRTKADLEVSAVGVTLSRTLLMKLKTGR